MKIIKSSWFPFGDYDAMAAWPFIFTKGEVSERVIRHEKIHCEQQKELLIVGFYLLYVMFFIAKFIWLMLTYYKLGFAHCWDYSYYMNPFEQEAYNNQEDSKYLEERKHFSWAKYIKKW